MESHTTDLTTNRKFWIEDNILLCKLSYANCFLTEDRIENYLTEIEEVLDGASLPLIVDIRKFIGSFAPEAAKRFADSQIAKRSIITQVFVADTLNAKLLVASYGRIFATNADIKVFSQMEAAVGYCKNYQKHLCQISG